MNDKRLNEIVNKTVSQALRKNLLKEDFVSSGNYKGYVDNLRKLYNLVEEEIQRLSDELLPAIKKGMEINAEIYNKFKEYFGKYLNGKEKNKYYSEAVLYTFKTDIKSISDEEREKMEYMFENFKNENGYGDNVILSITKDVHRMTEINIYIDILDESKMSEIGINIIEQCEQFV